MDNFDFVTFDWRKEKWPAEMMENKNNNSAVNEDFLSPYPFKEKEEEIFPKMEISTQLL